MNSKNSLKFQSFLIVGGNPHHQTTKIARQFNIDLEKPSPDISIISPEKKSISINQIRQLKSHINQKPVSSPHKLIVIKNAQHLTKQAQNSLLKIFEEPPKHAIIILEAKDESELLPTIVSRAIVIRTTAEIGIDQEESVLSSKKNTTELLEEISHVENPTGWIDNQISSLHQSLVDKIRNKNSNSTLEEIQNAIEQCAQSKKMIEANVNAKFVLANLIFNLKIS